MSHTIIEKEIQPVSLNEGDVVYYSTHRTDILFIIKNRLAYNFYQRYVPESGKESLGFTKHYIKFEETWDIANAPHFKIIGNINRDKEFLDPEFSFDKYPKWSKVSYMSL
jgi:hypothetical protein